MHRYNFQLSPTVHPFIATYKVTTTHTSAGETQSATDSDRFFTLAVRSDGATMRANALPDGQGRLPTVRSISFSDRYVVIDPFTRSLSSYKPYKPIVLPTQDCGGVPGSPVLGYRTQVGTKVISAEVSNPQATTTTWLALDLNCIMLRERYIDNNASEAVQVNREAISVTVGEPPSEYFDIPPDYQERGPLDIDSEAQKRFGLHVFGKGDPAILEKLQHAYQNARPQ